MHMAPMLAPPHIHTSSSHPSHTQPVLLGARVARKEASMYPQAYAAATTRNKTAPGPPPQHLKRTSCREISDLRTLLQVQATPRSTEALRDRDKQSKTIAVLLRLHLCMTDDALRTLTMQSDPVEVEDFAPGTNPFSRLMVQSVRRQ